MFVSRYCKIVFKTLLSSSSNVIYIYIRKPKVYSSHNVIIIIIILFNASYRETCRVYSWKFNWPEWCVRSRNSRRLDSPAAS